MSVPIMATEAWCGRDGAEYSDQTDTSYQFKYLSEQISNLFGRIIIIIIIIIMASLEDHK